MSPALLVFAAAWVASAPTARPPRVTPWAVAGARGIEGCAARERIAEASLANSGRTPEGDATWARHARECPGAPAVRMMAARAALVALAGPGLATLQDAEIDAAAARDAVARRDARAHLAAARAEVRRRGTAAPRGLLYLEAYAALADGAADLALARGRDALAAADAERWRIERLLAVAALLQGRLREAVALAHASLANASATGGGELQISTLVWAYALDRAGDPGEAARVLRASASRNFEGDATFTLETLLPFHERLYVQALLQTAHGNLAAAFTLWQRYLRRPEPEEPERVAAARWLAEVERVRQHAATPGH